MKDKEKLEEILAELKVYQEQSEIIKQQIDTIRSTIAELDMLDETLDAIDGKEGAEIFVPIGAGSFALAELKDTKNVIMSVGAGIAIKKSIKDAKSTLKKRRKELEKSVERLSKDLQKINEEISKLSPQAQELLKKVRGSE